MKKDKWLKWKIGAIASLGIALLFNEVKSSTSFQAANAELSESNETTTTTANQQDQIMNRDTWATDSIASTGKTNSPDYNSNTSRQTATEQTRTHTRTGRS